MEKPGFGSIKILPKKLDLDLYISYGDPQHFTFGKHIFYIRPEDLSPADLLTVKLCKYIH